MKLKRGRKSSSSSSSSIFFPSFFSFCPSPPLCLFLLSYLPFPFFFFFFSSSSLFIFFFLFSSTLLILLFLLLLFFHLSFLFSLLYPLLFLLLYPLLLFLLFPLLLSLLIFSSSFPSSCPSSTFLLLLVSTCNTGIILSCRSTLLLIHTSANKTLGF